MAELESTVNGWLGVQNAEKLEEVCGVLELPVTQAIKGKSRKLLKCILDYFCDLEDIVDGDGGHSALLKISDMIDEKKVSVSVSQSVGGETLEEKKGKSTIDIYKLKKDFKIVGTIGGKGDSLQFSSLLYQIDCGKRAGYSEQIICESVIRAISSSNPVRSYLEGKRTVSVDSLLEILNSTFREKDSGSILIEMGNAVQNNGEPCVDYVVRLMAMRDRILKLSQEEDVPFEKNMVQMKFFQSLFTGLRNSSIRSELRELCANNPKTPDETLLRFAAESAKNELERNEKFSSAKKSVVFEIEADNDLDEIKSKKPKKTNPLSHLEKTVDDVAMLKAELLEMKTLLTENLKLRSDENQRDGGWSGYSRGRGRGRGFSHSQPRNKCKDCLETRSFCNHCFICGEEGHKSFGCSTKGNE